MNEQSRFLCIPAQQLCIWQCLSTSNESAQVHMVETWSSGIQHVGNSQPVSFPAIMLHFRKQALDYRDVSKFFSFNDSRALGVTNQKQRNILFSLKLPILQIRAEANSLLWSTENEWCLNLLFLFVLSLVVLVPYDSMILAEHPQLFYCPDDHSTHHCWKWYLFMPKTLSWDNSLPRICAVVPCSPCKGNNGLILSI